MFCRGEGMEKRLLLLFSPYLWLSQNCAITVNELLICSLEAVLMLRIMLINSSSPPAISGIFLWNSDSCISCFSAPIYQTLFRLLLGCLGDVQIDIWLFLATCNLGFSCHQTPQNIYICCWWWKVFTFSDHWKMNRLLKYISLALLSYQASTSFRFCSMMFSYSHRSWSKRCFKSCPGAAFTSTLTSPCPLWPRSPLSVCSNGEEEMNHKKLKLKKCFMGRITWFVM